MRWELHLFAKAGEGSLWLTIPQNCSFQRTSPVSHARWSCRGLYPGNRRVPSPSLFFFDKTISWCFFHGIRTTQRHFKSQSQLAALFTVHCYLFSSLRKYTGSCSRYTEGRLAVYCPNSSLLVPKKQINRYQTEHKNAFRNPAERIRENARNSESNFLTYSCNFRGNFQSSIHQLNPYKRRKPLFL